MGKGLSNHMMRLSTVHALTNRAERLGLDYRYNRGSHMVNAKIADGGTHQTAVWTESAVEALRVMDTMTTVQQQGESVEAMRATDYLSRARQLGEWEASLW